ncbi:MAG TPA: CHAT domain-containing protein, partial [Myxococcaceae bacterium]|nr:CHAT domain-containing protein [Myxococcaceae bacterium]
DRVAAALPADGALVELIAYADRPLVPVPGAPETEPPGTLRYLALVLFPDARIRPVDLGPAAPIDAATARLRAALTRRDAAYLAPAQALHQLVFRPLAAVLGSTGRVFLAPDGQLALVPFDALHDGRRFVIDAFDITYLTSGKDLLPRPLEVPASVSVVVVADPDFGARVPAAPPTPRGELLAERGPSAGLSSSALRELGERSWGPLPGTRQEAESLRRLFPQAKVFVAEDATKDRLLHVTAPGILHIATHGFFLEDATAPADARGVVQVQGAASGLGPRRPPDPLLRSGLVLAGAQARESGAEPAQPRVESSLATALELAGLDLWGTQLVVLSACDTGRGDVKLGQGVYGLRRALVVAGAETVVMSLWKVNDGTTRALMEDYYRHLLAGEGRTAALREAMLSLRQLHPHPHFWAPFISLGKDAPLGTQAGGG